MLRHEPPLLFQRERLEPRPIHRQRPRFADAPHVRQRLLQNARPLRPFDYKHQIQISVPNFAHFPVGRFSAQPRCEVRRFGRDVIDEGFGVEALEEGFDVPGFGGEGFGILGGRGGGDARQEGGDVEVVCAVGLVDDALQEEGLVIVDSLRVKACSFL